mmetsp:Transcript_58759/g.133017  ORF Transcript_58759/g.133017 Transcript_58759/m.133017 type:complete len:83 (-) Transcript_58759:95-343(-)
MLAVFLGNRFVFFWASWYFKNGRKCLGCFFLLQQKSPPQSAQPPLFVREWLYARSNTVAAQTPVGAKMCTRPEELAHATTSR